MWGGGVQSRSLHFCISWFCSGSSSFIQPNSARQGTTGRRQLVGTLMANAILIQRREVQSLSEKGQRISLGLGSVLYIGSALIGGQGSSSLDRASGDITNNHFWLWRHAWQLLRPRCQVVRHSATWLDRTTWHWRVFASTRHRHARPVWLSLGLGRRVVGPATVWTDLHDPNDQPAIPTTECIAQPH